MSAVHKKKKKRFLEGLISLKCTPQRGTVLSVYGFQILKNRSSHLSRFVNNRIPGQYEGRSRPVLDLDMASDLSGNLGR